MVRFLRFASKLSIGTHIFAGAMLIFMMIVTLCEVVMRSFGKPIIGAYELISFTGGIVIGFAIPYTSWMRGHVYVDAIINRFSEQRRDVINATTRCLAMLLFLFAGWNFMVMGGDLYRTKEVTTTLRLPFYPIAFGLGVSFFIQTILLFADMLKVIGGNHE